MRAFILLGVLSILPLAACGDRPSDDNEVVDTTLNDTATTSTRAPDNKIETQNVREASNQAGRRRTTSERREVVPRLIVTDDTTTEKPEPEMLGPRKAVADVNIRSLFSADDYPAAAIAAGAQGIDQAELTIGQDGRVVGCDLLRSSGNSALDAATCNILRRRAKFTPARDANGEPMSDTVITPPIVWRLGG